MTHLAEGWRYKVSLPSRRLATYVRDRRRREQFCKACGRTQNEVGFVVADATWEAVVPARWQSLAICLACFDRFASERGLHTVKVFLVNGP